MEVREIGDRQCLLAERMECALARSGFWHHGRLCLHFVSAMEQLFPEIFCDPPGKAERLKTVGGTLERLQELVDRADSGRHLFHPSDADVEVLERFATIVSLSARTKPGAGRADLEIVVETAHGVQLFGEVCDEED